MKKRYKVKPTSKLAAERDDYAAWLKNHESEHIVSMQRLIRTVKANNDALVYWKQEHDKLEKLRRDAITNGQLLPPMMKPQKRGGIDTSNMSVEELAALKKREQAAQAELKIKKARTGPVYNKGNYVFLSDDLLKDVKAGNTRRRN